MKYKMLLTGRNQSVIDDFFQQADDQFEAMTSSSRYTDIVRHLKYFEPDIFVYCVYNESVDTFSTMTNVKTQLNLYEIPFILIGSKEDCEEFERTSTRNPDLVLVKPLTAETIVKQILYFMGVWNKRKAERARVQKAKDVTAPKTETVTAPKTEAVVKSAPKTRRHILVVDDSPMMLKTLKENLQEDYDIATAISGKVAMKFLERKKTDLILLDYEMPEENGPAVLEKIRANDEIKDIPVIFLTGVTDSGKIREALVLKPKGYLLKPINREKLLEAIERVFE